MERAITSYKPDITKKGLLLIASVIWFGAGFFLIQRGYFYILENSHHILFHFMIGFTTGIFFFFVLFFSFSKKIIKRIVNLNSEKPNIFSIISFRDYFMMILFIGIGLYLRRTCTFDHINFSIAYTCIGIALIFSSLKFLYSFIAFKKTSNPKPVSSF